MKGKLYIVPTPIGNLADITYRAIDVLKAVDAILAEDTRQTKKLLDHYNIKQKLIPYHQHNEHKNSKAIIERICNGDSLAVCSDAGMPGISDPGFLLIREAIQADIEVITLPGAVAAIVGIVGSGIQGVCTGLQLIKKGIPVTIFDRHDPLSKEFKAASYGNAGHFSPYAVLQFNRPDVLYDVPKMLLSSYGPLALKWNYIPKMFNWFLH